ncbi:MAG: RHS repeat-associated core domain-containing protein [Pyrinomonadaceae bacterium]
MNRTPQRRDAQRIHTFVLSPVAWLNVVMLIAVLGVNVMAQNNSNTDGATPMSLTPGSPAGSYALSGFDNINLFNGNLNFHLPLLSVNGRGDARMQITLPIEKRWRVGSFVAPIFAPNAGDTIYWAESNWWSGLKPGYGPGVLHGRVSYMPAPFCDFSNQTSGSGGRILTRLTFTTPDGTEYELRDQATGGKPIDHNSPCVQWGASRGQIFTSADGTAATFISDTTIYDNAWAQGEDYSVFYPTGFLVLRNGTRYRIENGLVKWMRDRNGNKLTFAYDNHEDPQYVPANRVIAITDSLNRQVTVTYDVQEQPYGLCDKIALHGFGGAPRTIRVCRTNLGNALRADANLQTDLQLFPQFNGSCSTCTFDPPVTSAVWLPDGRAYRFYYNSYGELARVLLPTGGAHEYDYAAGLTNGPASGAWLAGHAASSSQADSLYRRVVEKRIYTEGSVLVNRSRFSRPESMFGCSGSNCVQTSGFVDLDNLGPSENLLTRTRHYFYGAAADYQDWSQDGYPKWRTGKEHKTESIDSDGVTVLRRTTQSWQQRAPVSWWSSFCPMCSSNPDEEPANDPRISETQTELTDTSPVLVSKRIIGYDNSVPFNNQNSVKEYDFGDGEPGPLVRDTRTTFITSPTYTNTSVRLLSLPQQISIWDGEDKERARTDFEYDNYVSDPGNFHAPLMPRGSISGQCDGTTQNCPNGPNFGAQDYVTRGNVTKLTRYLLHPSGNGSVIGAVASHSHYDVAGNVVKLIDPRSTVANLIATTVHFDDRFGAPDGDARNNSGATELNNAGQYSYAFPTLTTNALGHTAYTQFDFYLGLPVDGEDANGIVSSGIYNDPLDRPKQVIRAVNGGANVKSQTTFTYDDVNRLLTTTSDQDSYGDNILKTEISYDGLGRATEQRQFETGANYIAVQTQYDALGRAFKTSNPFRPWQGESAIWTTTGFDALGRVTTVTTPDNAMMVTSYSGNTLTVSDQAGKQRKSVTDGLGRLAQVVEAPNDPNFHYLTIYAYDALDDLLTITQGTQTPRSFTYDSLKRPTSTWNPESGTISYQYDNNGNVIQKTDARGIVTSFLPYDALNRPTTKNYSDGTPSVTYSYDSTSISNGKGRLASVTSNVSTYSYSGYDGMGRPLGGTQTIGSRDYSMTSTYDLAGHVKTLGYPSGRGVTYNYDNAGRLADKDSQNLAFTGNLGGTARNYATGIAYASNGGWTRETFGTDTLLYNKRHFNVRQQLYDMRVSTVNDEFNWNRGAIVNYYSLSNFGFGTSGADNNANLYVQQHWVPNDDAISSHTFMQQNYDYDAVNRLKWVGEYQNGTTPTGGQNYGYDPYGNRTLTGSGTGINNLAFEVETATNRLLAPGDLGLPDTSRRMQYDPAGNLKTDTYTGQGGRTYDAENRMITSAGTSPAIYAYDAAGHRVKRIVGTTETWQVYGLSGELIAEYAADNAAATPQKEYGYRNGELLITATINTAGWGPPPTYTGPNPLSTGDPMTLENLTELRTAVNQLRQHAGLQPFNFTVDPNPERNVTTLKADHIRQLRTAVEQARSALGLSTGGYAHPTLTEGVSSIFAIDFQELRNQISSAWNNGTGGVDIRWLVTDQLGTPRMIFDQSGSLTVTDQNGNYVSGMTRHDYLPFGEELFAGSGGRTTGKGYAVGDNVRQKFTQKEHDPETGLDYFGARYYSGQMGRFTTPDPFMPSAEVTDPQTWNRYSYVLNNPLRFVDPLGLSYEDLSEEQRRVFSTYAAKHNDGGKLTDAQVYATLDESQMTTFESITQALEKTTLTNDKNGKSMGNALSLVASVDEIVGENVGGKTHHRLYVNLTSAAVGTLEKAKEFGGGLFNGLAADHKRFGKDGSVITEFSDNVRQGGGKPSIQISYAKDRIQADIDIDYRGLGSGHTNHYNSDVRQVGPEKKGGAPINNYQLHVDRWPGLRQWWQQKTRSNDYYKGKSKT